LVIASGRHEEVPFGGEVLLGGPYPAIGQPERGVEWCRAQLARGRDRQALKKGMPRIRSCGRRLW
jgi:hypothetical protein